MRALRQSGYGQTILTILNDDNIPLFFRIQRADMLNYGEIIRGKITQKNEILRGYFIETTKGLSVFAPSHENYCVGQSVFVQITKEARLGKDATGKIRADITLESLPDIAENLSVEIGNIHDDTDNLTNELIDDALLSLVPFENGACLNIERTQSCWSIDVDSGSSTTSLNDINEMACALIHQQVLLKNMSGVIVIDFAGFKNSAEQKQITEKLKRLFANDTRTTVYGFTRTKLFEIKRTRTTAAIHDLFQTPDGHKHPLSLVPVIMRQLLQNKNGKIRLILHPTLLPHLPKNITIYCTIQTDLNIPVDYFELKGE